MHSATLQLLDCAGRCIAHSKLANPSKWEDIVAFVDGPRPLTNPFNALGWKFQDALQQNSELLTTFYNQLEGDWGVAGHTKVSIFRIIAGRAQLDQHPDFCYSAGCVWALIAGTRDFGLMRDLAVLGPVALHPLQNMHYRRGLHKFALYDRAKVQGWPSPEATWRDFVL